MAIKKGSRTFFALAVLLFAGDLANAQQTGVRRPITTAQADTGNPQFRTVIFSRAPGDDQIDTTVGPEKIPTIIRTGAQLSARNKINDDDANFNIRTDLPGPERLFDTRKSEAMMQEYIRRDSTVRTGSNRILFPEYTPLAKEPYAGRQFPRSTLMVEPNYVCHGRLYFEQPNFERAGWDLGYATPAVNLGVFYYDVFMLPYHTWTNPCVCYDCNVGKCMPGDNTPLYFYREPFSVSGLAGQTLAVGTGLFLFP